MRFIRKPASLKGNTTMALTKKKFSLSSLFNTDVDNVPKLEGTEEESQRLNGMISTLRRSKMGRQVLSAAEEHGYTIKFSDEPAQAKAFGLNDPNSKMILLNPHVDDSILLTTIAHECRHSEQANNDILYTQDHTPQAAVQIQRAMEGDAQAAAAQTAWELKTEGQPEAWNAFDTNYPEITKPYAAKAAQRGADDGQAMQAGFTGWHQNAGNRRFYENRLLEIYEQMSTDTLTEAGTFTDNGNKVLKAVQKKLKVNGNSYLKGHLPAPELASGMSPENRNRLRDVLMRRLERTGDSPLKYLEPIPSTPHDAFETPQNTSIVPPQASPVASAPSPAEINTASHASPSLMHAFNQDIGYTPGAVSYSTTGYTLGNIAMTASFSPSLTPHGHPQDITKHLQATPSPKDDAPPAATPARKITTAMLAAHHSRAQKGRGQS
jgi:hypothetical protein